MLQLTWKLLGSYLAVIGSYLGQFDALQPLSPFALGKPLLPQVPAGHAMRVGGPLPLILSPWAALTPPVLNSESPATIVTTTVTITNFNISTSNNFWADLCQFSNQATADFKFGR
jgi:hypothetical protein